MIVSGPGCFPNSPITLSGYTSLRQCGSSGRYVRGPARTERLHSFMCFRQRAASYRARVGQPSFSKSKGPHSFPAAASPLVLEFYAQLNNRNVLKIANVLAEDCLYDSLAVGKPLTGRDNITWFFLDTLRLIPDSANFIMDEVSYGQDQRVGVVWHLQLPAPASSPLSEGITFFTLDPASMKITRIYDSLQPWVRASLTLADMAVPMMRNMDPAVGSLMTGAASVMQQSMESLGLTSPNWIVTAVQAIQDTSLTVAAYSSQPPYRHDGPTVSATPQSGEASASMGGHDVSLSAQRLMSPTTKAYGTPQASAKSDINNMAGQHYGPLQSRQGTTDDKGELVVVPSPSHQSQEEGPMDLSGLWEKDPLRSDIDGYEASLDVMRLSGLQKVTARLIEGLDIRHTSQTFQVSFVTIVPFFKVTENYDFGRPTSLMRRDLRRGQATARAAQHAAGVTTVVEWGKPLPGHLEEQYEVLEDGALKVTSSVHIEGRSSSSHSVYVRSGKSKEEFLRSSRQRNGSMQDVLASQERQFGSS